MKTLKKPNLYLLILFLCCEMAFSQQNCHDNTDSNLPTGYNLEFGEANCSIAGNIMTINQMTQNVDIDFSSYNISNISEVNYIQPNSNSIAFNRVTGQDPSRIAGSLMATGIVYLLNPNGILFRPNARINVGGLVAAAIMDESMDLNDREVLLSGSVTNEGQINSDSFVVLAGQKVTNSGSITASRAQAALLAGDAVKVDNIGDGAVFLSVTDNLPLESNVAISGDIEAEEGEIQIQGGDITIEGQLDAHEDISITDGFSDNISALEENSQVAISGRIQAQNGKIKIETGKVEIAGPLTAKEDISIIASGRDNGGTDAEPFKHTSGTIESLNGSIIITADDVDLKARSEISAHGNIVTFQTHSEESSWTLGEPINKANTLELSQLELEQIDVDRSGMLRIGSDKARTGSIQSQINDLAGVNNLVLEARTISDENDGAIMLAGKLGLLSSGNITIDNTDTNIDILAVNTGGEGNLVFTNADDFTIGTIAEISGISASESIRIDGDKTITIDGVKLETISQSSGTIDLRNSPIEIEGESVVIRTGKDESFSGEGSIRLHGNVRSTSQDLTLNAGEAGEIQLNSIVGSLEGANEVVGRLEVIGSLVNDSGNITISVVGPLIVQDIEAMGDIELSISGRDSGDLETIPFQHKSGTIRSTNGSITISANDMDLSGEIELSSSINESEKRTISLLSHSPTHDWELGGTGDMPDKLELSQFDLENIRTGDNGILRIGDKFSQRGEITDSVKISNDDIETLKLAAATIVDKETGNLDFQGALALESAGDIILKSHDNNFYRIAAKSINGNVEIANIDKFTIGKVDAGKDEIISGITARRFITITEAQTVTIDEVDITTEDEFIGRIELKANHIEIESESKEKTITLNTKVEDKFGKGDIEIDGVVTSSTNASLKLISGDEGNAGTIFFDNIGGNRGDGKEIGTLTIIGPVSSLNSLNTNKENIDISVLKPLSINHDIIADGNINITVGSDPLSSAEKHFNHSGGIIQSREGAVTISADTMSLQGTSIEANKNIILNSNDSSISWVLGEGNSDSGQLFFDKDTISRLHVPEGSGKLVIGSINSPSGTILKDFELDDNINRLGLTLAATDLDFTINGVLGLAVDPVGISGENLTLRSSGLERSNVDGLWINVTGNIRNSGFDPSSGPPSGLVIFNTNVPFASSKLNQLLRRLDLDILSNPILSTQADKSEQSPDADNEQDRIAQVKALDPDSWPSIIDIEEEIKNFAKGNDYK